VTAKDETLRMIKVDMIFGEAVVLCDERSMFEDPTGIYILEAVSWHSAWFELPGQAAV
jgi:hypothetical protein